MQINFFLLFPETGDEVLSLATDNESCKKIYDFIAHVNNFARQNEFDFTFYYDSDNFAKFKEVVDVSDEKTYMHRIVTGIQIQMKSNMHDLKYSSLINHDCIYTLWDSLTMQSIPDVHNVVKNAGEGAVIPDHSCLLSFVDGQPTVDAKLNIIKDKFPAEPSLPVLFTIPIFRDYLVVELWLKQFVKGFSLKNKALFRVTPYRWPQSDQQIYQKIEDNTYWYFDFFHRNNRIHYEVYDEAGNYLGESDANGCITPSKEVRSIAKLLGKRKQGGKN